MKYFKCVLFLILIIFSTSGYVYSSTVRIYKLKNINIESEKKYFNGGLIFPNQNGEIIGFTLDKNYTGDKGIEITSGEYLDYVESLKLTHKKVELTPKEKKILANDILVSKQNKTIFSFFDEEVENANDVKKIVKAKINELSENNELDLIVLLLAYMGKIQFNQTGIQEINTQLEADNYLTNFYNNTIKKINNIKTQAEQFIRNNNLK